VPLAQQPMAVDNTVPYLIFRCIQEIETRGIESEGIYRLGGIKSAIENLCTLFEERGNSEQDVDLSSESDINAIAGCLKSFLRQVFSFFLSLKSIFCFFMIILSSSLQLPEPLVPHFLYTPLISMAKQQDISIQAFCGILSDFPSINFATLDYLISHLR